MRKSIFFPTCLPRTNSIPATHFATKLGRQGCRRKTKTCHPNDCVDYNDLIIIALLAILYMIFKKCGYVSSLPRVCFPLYPFSTILQGTARTDIFVEVVNLASAEAMWAHFASVAVHPSQLQITGYPRAYDMHIIKLCCCRQLQIDWQNIVLCDLDRNIIKLPALGKISLWSTNDLASIETNMPYQIRVYGRVLDLVIPLEIKDDVHITDHRLYWAVDNLATRKHCYM